MLKAGEEMYPLASFRSISAVNLTAASKPRSESQGVESTEVDVLDVNRDGIGSFDSEPALDMREARRLAQKAGKTVLTVDDVKTGWFGWGGEAELVAGGSSKPSEPRTLTELAGELTEQLGFDDRPVEWTLDTSDGTFSLHEVRSFEERSDPLNPSNRAKYQIIADFAGGRRR